MRSIRKIRPTQENDFSLNDIDAFSEFAVTYLAASTKVVGP
jgi:hypothetical protein